MASVEILSGTLVSLIRGGRLLFEDLSFDLKPSEALLVTGRNGAGKSSLLRVVAGLLEPDGGQLTNPFKTALLSSDQALKGEALVRDELAFWAKLDGADAAQVAQAVESVAIGPLLDFRCGQLSSGQRQRVAIARLIAANADLWLLDEPTNALDAASEARLLEVIAAHRSRGGLVMAATHQPMPLPGAKHLVIGS